MKITIYELLGLVKDGKAPKKIKYQNYIYEYQHRIDTENSFNYMCNENGEYLSRRYFIDNILNEEVEILEEEKKDNFTGWKLYRDGKEVYLMDCSAEEEKKIPEKIRHDACWIYDDETNQSEKITLKDDLILNKLDDIIDYLDYLKSKGE